MADRRDFFFRQRVTEGELDEGFDLLEVADRKIVEDAGLYGLAQNGDVTEASGTPDLTVDISGPGVAYDQDGQRIPWSGASQNVDVSVDEAAANTAVVTPGNEKWLSIFVAFDRALSNPRTDGTGATVQYDRDESFTFNVVQGAEAGAGLATRPALRGDEVLLADVLIVFGTTQVLNADIDKTRTEYFRRARALTVTEDTTLLGAALKLALGGFLGTDLVGSGALFTGTLGLVKIAEWPTAQVDGASLVAMARIYVTPNGGLLLTFNAGFNETTDLWVSDADMYASALLLNLGSSGAGARGTPLQSMVREVAAAAETWADSAWTWDSTSFGTVIGSGTFFTGAGATLENGRLLFTGASATGTNPPVLTSPGSSNALYAKNLVKVWGKVEINAGTVTMSGRDGFGIASVAAAAPDFTINFSINFANSQYSFEPTPWYESSLGAVLIAHPTAFAVGSVTCELRRCDTGAAVSIAGVLAFIHFSIKGEQA